MVATIILEKPQASPVDLADGVLVPQSEEVLRQPVYSKFESLNNLVSDYQHSTEWEEEIIASPQTATGRALLMVASDGQERALMSDLGVIVRLAGRLAGEVAISQGRVLTLDEADTEEEATGRSTPRYNKWDFFIKWVKFTDGPVRRERLHRSYEQQKQEEITSMAAAIREAFRSALQGQSVTANPDPARALEQMEPEQLMALAQARLAEREQAQFDAQQAQIREQESLAAEVAAEKAKRDAKVPKAH